MNIFDNFQIMTFDNFVAFHRISVYSVFSCKHYAHDKCCEVKEYYKGYCNATW